MAVTISVLGSGNSLSSRITNVSDTTQYLQDIRYISPDKTAICTDPRLHGQPMHNPKRMLLHPGHSLGLQELVVAPNSTKPPKPTALPSSVRQDGFIMNSQSINMNGPEG